MHRKVPGSGKLFRRESRLLRLVRKAEEQGAALADAFRTRCPVYTTFVRAAPIELEVEVVSN